MSSFSWNLKKVKKMQASVNSRIGKGFPLPNTLPITLISKYSESGTEILFEIWLSTKSNTFVKFILHVEIVVSTFRVRNVIYLSLVQRVLFYQIDKIVFFVIFTTETNIGAETGVSVCGFKKPNRTQVQHM